MLCITSTENRSWVQSQHSLGGKTIEAKFSSSIVVEFAKESRPRRDVYEGGGERNHG
jgi:hypothetical protein